MHVQPLVEGVQQRLIAADMGHDAQLNLAVISAGNHAARRRHKRLAHAPPLGRADRDVLQIGVVAGQTARHRHRLRVVGMHAPGRWQGQLREFVGVGALELGQSPVLQNFGRQGEVFGQFF